MTPCNICGLTQVPENESYLVEKGDPIPNEIQICPLRQASGVNMGTICVGVIRRVFEDGSRKDETGREVKIAVTPSDNRSPPEPQHEVTDETGWAVFLSKPAGTYDVKVMVDEKIMSDEFCGNSTRIVNQVTVEDNKTTLLYVELETARREPVDFVALAAEDEPLDLEPPDRSFIEQILHGVEPIKTWSDDEQNQHVLHNKSVLYLEKLASEAAKPAAQAEEMKEEDEKKEDEREVNELRAANLADLYTKFLRDSFVAAIVTAGGSEAMKEHLLKHTLLGKVPKYNRATVAHELNKAHLHPSYWGLFIHGPGYADDIISLREGRYPTYKRTPPDGELGVSIYRTPGHGRDDFLTVCSPGKVEKEHSSRDASESLLAARNSLNDIPERLREAQNTQQERAEKLDQIVEIETYLKRIRARCEAGELELKDEVTAWDGFLTTAMDELSKLPDQKKEIEGLLSRQVKLREDMELAIGVLVCERNYLTFCTKGTGLDVFRKLETSPNLEKTLGHLEPMIKKGGNDVLICLAKASSGSSTHLTAGYCASEGQDAVTADFEAFLRVATAAKAFAPLASAIADPLAVVVIANIKYNRQRLQPDVLEFKEPGLPAQIVTVAPAETAMRMRDVWKTTQGYRLVDETSRTYDEQAEQVEYARAMSMVRKGGHFVVPEDLLSRLDTNAGRLKDQRILTAYSLIYTILASLSVVQRLGMSTGKLGDSFDPRNISSAIRDSDEWGDMIRPSFPRDTMALNDIRDASYGLRNALLSAGVEVTTKGKPWNHLAVPSFMQDGVEGLENALFAVLQDVFGLMRPGQGSARYEYKIRDLSLHAAQRKGTWETFGSAHIAKLAHLIQALDGSRPLTEPEKLLYKNANAELAPAVRTSMCKHVGENEAIRLFLPEIAGLFTP